MRAAGCALLLAGLASGCGVQGLAGAEGESRSVRAMTFNIGGGDGALDLIIAEAPDILGLQEALWGQVQDLEVGLPDYEWVGVGRDDGIEGGEFTPIFYRSDRYEHIAHGTFWLSDTPNVPGSTYEDGEVRIATWLEVSELESGQPILALNSHWDEHSQQARAFGASFIVQQLSFLAPSPRARLVIGDFNCDEDSEPMNTLRNGGRLDDVYRVAHPTVSENEATSHGFSGDPRGARMDFLMVSTGLFEVERAAIVRAGSSEEGWPSDHFPVVGDLRW